MDDLGHIPRKSIETTLPKAKPQVQNIYFTAIVVPPARLSAPQTISWPVISPFCL
jgi:hypothetical protein